MTHVLHLDPFGGAAGDMLLGALIDLGAPLGDLQQMLAGLGLAGWRLIAEPDRQQGFAGTRVRVEVEEESHPARHLADVERLLSAAPLPERVRDRALTAFRTLFEAEATVHGVAVQETHLHELAAVDAVVDIVGVCTAVELLGVEHVTCGPVPLGSGVVQTAHGVLPVPPPAVARLMIGVPLAGHVADGEMTTPTGATLVKTLSESFGPPPAGAITRIGVGLGTRRFAGVPNFLRAFLIAPGRPHLCGRAMAVVETTVDDVTGEAVGWLAERLREAGAVDAWCLAGTGRKGRPVSELRALVELARVDDVLAVLFSEGGTLGARVIACDRTEIARSTREVSTAYGVIPVKIGAFGGRVVSAKPEHDSCAAAARKSGVSLATVVDAGRRAAPAVGTIWEESA